MVHLNHKSNKIRSSIFTVASLGVFLSFLVGIWIFDVIKAIKVTTSHGYFSYEAYRLIALYFTKPLAHLWRFVLIFPLFFLLLVWGVNRVVKRYHDTYKEKLVFGFTILVAAIFFAGTGWLVNRYWLVQTKFHPVSLAVDAGLLVFSFLFIRLLFKLGRKIQWMTRFENLKESRSIKVSALLLVLFLLGSSFFVNKYIDDYQPSDGPNIVVIMIDTLRQDHLGYSGYQRDTSPFIDELAKEGVVFKNAYSAAPWTRPSVASFLTSLYPNKHTAINFNNNLPNGVLTVAELLRNRGWETCAFNAGNATIGKSSNVMQGFNRYFNRRVPAPELTDRFLKLLPQLKKERFFAYIHYMDVHLPYNQNEYNFQYTQKNPDSPFIPGDINHKDAKQMMKENKLTDSDKLYLEAIYDGQIRYVDDSVKQIVTALKDKGLYRNTIVVVTSDHGEEFWEHGLYEHGHTVYNELVHIPMIFAGNGLTHRLIDRPIQTIDLMPTLLNMANVTFPTFKPDGKNIFHHAKPNKDPKPEPIFIMGTLRTEEKYAVILEGKKLINNTGNDQGKGKDVIDKKRPQFEYFNLSTDPSEQENLIQSDSEKARIRLMKELLKHFIGKTANFKSQKTVLDKKTKESLKTLGYL